MKLGFVSGCLPDWSFRNVAEWSAANGYDSLEVSAWPKLGPRRGPTHIDPSSFDDEAEAEVRAAMQSTGVGISALGYYDNNLHHDSESRALVHQHLLSCIDVAVRLELDTVGTFVGRDVTLSVAENLVEGARVLPRLVDYAGERGVKLSVENCPMEGWHPDGYPANLAYSPELWEWMFSLGLTLNYDPSHLMWLHIDPAEALKPYIPHISLVQAKDTELFPEKLNHYGVFGKTIGRADEWDVGWWRYRVPGRGMVDWRTIIDLLHSGGYRGHVSVEHEDPVWGGSDSRVQEGLLIAQETLRPLIRS